MNINVPVWARDHFWEEPPPGHDEFWSFRFRPPCAPDDRLVFRFDGKPVAEAVVTRIEPPGQSECAGTGRFGSGWKVFWHPGTFVKLRQTEVSK
jgi:hypothetical protein